MSFQSWIDICREPEPESVEEVEEDEPIYVAKMFCIDYPGYEFIRNEYCGFSRDEAVQSLQHSMKYFRDLHPGSYGTKYVGYIEKWKNGLNDTADEEIKYDDTNSTRTS